MEENFNIAEELNGSDVIATEAKLEALLETCEQLKNLAHHGHDSAIDELRGTLEEYAEDGYGVFSIDGQDDLADPISDDDFAMNMVEKAVERRKEEGLEVEPTHAIISSCGQTLLVNTEDFTQCTVVRNS